MSSRDTVLIGGLLRRVLLGAIVTLQLYMWSCESEQPAMSYESYGEALNRAEARWKSEIDVVGYDGGFVRILDDDVPDYEVTARGLAQFVAALHDIQPPADLLIEHESFADASSRVSDSTTRVAASLARGTPERDAFEILDLEMIRDWEESCLTLRDAALQRSIQLTLTCGS